MSIKVITVREKSNDNDVFIHFTTRKGYKCIKFYKFTVHDTTNKFT